jgi:hypothetical protein
MGELNQMLRSIFIATVAIAIAGCAAKPATQGAQLKITQDVWSSFQAYLQDKTTAHSGAFAVTTDGKGWGGGICDDLRCYGSSKEFAVNSCEKHNPGHDCVVFAYNNDIVVPYEVLP